MAGAVLAGDPDKYIRRVRRKFQARPCDQGRRYNLGLFPSREAARAAVRDFWWGKYPDLPRYIQRRRLRDGTVHFWVWVFANDQLRRAGPFPTLAAAESVRDLFLEFAYGPGWRARLAESYAGKRHPRKAKEAG